MAQQRSIIANKPTKGAHWFAGGCRVEERRGCLGHAATLRFLSPLIEPDMGAPIRLSDKTSGVRSRKAMSRRLQFDEPQGLVEVLVRKACSPCAANLMLRA